MIVIGYQGIGKSTLANNCLKYIDLESGCFWMTDTKTNQTMRHSDWYKPYCNTAEHLSRQGYVVFVSSHEAVRNELKKSTEKVVCCVPDVSLRDKWIKKLEMRYSQSGLEKDYKAYMNAVDRFTENIEEIQISGFEVVKIDKMSYSLRELLEKEDGDISVVAINDLLKSTENEVANG